MYTRTCITYLPFNKHLKRNTSVQPSKYRLTTDVHEKSRMFLRNRRNLFYAWTFLVKTTKNGTDTVLTESSLEAHIYVDTSI